MLIYNMFEHIKFRLQGLVRYSSGMLQPGHSGLALHFFLCFLVAMTWPSAAWGEDIKGEYYLQKAADESLAPNLRLKYVDSLNTLEPIWKNGEVKSKVYLDAGRRKKAVECCEAMLAEGNLPLNRRLWALYRLGIGFSATAQYSNVLKTALRILKAEKPDSLRYYDAKAMLLVANTYNRLRNFSMCERYLTKADSILKHSKCSEEIKRTLNNDIQINLSGVLLDQQRYDEALKLCKKLEKMDLPARQRKFLDMNYAHLFDYKGEPKIAEEYYRHLIQNTTENDVYNINFESAMYNYSLFLLNRKRYAESEAVCRAQIPRTFVSGERNIRGLLYEILGRSLAKQGRHEEAFDAILISMATIDSVRSERSPDMSTVTSAFEMQLSELERSKEHLGAPWPWWLTAILFILVLGVSVWAGMLIWRANSRSRRRQHGLWHRMRQSGVEHFVDTAETTEGLDDANRKLVALSLEKAQKDGILAEVADVVEAPTGSPRDKLTAIRNVIRGLPDTDHRWEVFRAHFEKVHPRFFSNLHEAHPDLTPGDAKMAAFIVMNLSAKEIAAMLCRSQRTVDSARYRLHKKLGLGVGEKSLHYLRSLL